MQIVHAKVLAYLYHVTTVYQSMLPASKMRQFFFRRLSEYTLRQGRTLILLRKRNRNHKTALTNAPNMEYNLHMNKPVQFNRVLLHQVLLILPLQLKYSAALLRKYAHCHFHYSRTIQYHTQMYTLISCYSSKVVSSNWLKLLVPSA